ncbi:MAG TPA: septum formation initiator family protein [Bryobacteraceae bacterium]|jgi:cell division protein FtsB|nr:septum formation initiator family protein [Bryobacteraceae bacterium]
MKNAVRRTLFLLVAGVIGVYGYLALRGPQGIPALREKWRQIRTLEEDNSNLQRENQYRRDRIKKLEENPSAQELEIRKKLKLVRPGETSFILPDQPKADQAKPDQAKPDQAKPDQPGPEQPKPEPVKPDAPSEPK